jgi:hypothetical protein
MASAAPDPDELHKLTIVLAGRSLRGSRRARAIKYYEYMSRLRTLAAAYGARVESNDLCVGQAMLRARERRQKPLAKRRG